MAHIRLSFNYPFLSHGVLETTDIDDYNDLNLFGVDIREYKALKLPGAQLRSVNPLILLSTPRTSEIL